MDVRRAQQRFLRRLAPAGGLEALFEHLADVYLFVKDAESRFIFWNQGFAALAQARPPEALWGKTDADFFPRDMADNFRRDDRVVLTSGRTLVDRPEPMRTTDGSIRWYTTTKIPLRDGRGRVIGLAGFTRDLAKMNVTSARFAALAPVVERLLTDYGQPLTVAALAREIGLSVSQLERQFKRHLHTTPRKYLLKVRLDAASQSLLGSDASVAEIARATGFHDPSHLAHQFKADKGLTPSAYRERYRTGRS